MISKILKELIAAGLQGESLVAAVERIEQAQPKVIDATAERRRAKDRERYYRKVGRTPPKPPFTPNSTETTEEALSSLLSSSISTTKIVESKKERARKSQLPADWQPKPSHYELGKRFNLSETIVELRADALRDWAGGKGIMRSDWDKVFNGFIRPKEGHSNGFGGPRPLQDDTKSVSAAARRLEAATASGEFTIKPRPSLLPESRSSDLRLLPKG